MKSIIDWTFEQGQLVPDSLRGLFARLGDSKEFHGKMHSLHFKILAPHLANAPYC